MSRVFAEPDDVLYPTLSPEQCQDLIQTEIATGGMRAKLESATDAVRSGVPEIVIAPGTSRWHRVENFWPVNRSELGCELRRGGARE